MDKTLTTILITAVVSVIAKEFLTWLVSVIKNMSAAKTLASKFRALFTRKNLEIFGNLLAMIFYIGILVNFARTDTPPTRMEILIIIGSVIAILFVSLNLLIEFAKFRISKSKNVP
jgi:threonine/homoserine/homoserine lactone efflux protein